MGWNGMGWHERNETNVHPPRWLFSRAASPATRENLRGRGHIRGASIHTTIKGALTRLFYRPQPIKSTCFPRSNRKLSENVSCVNRSPCRLRLCNPPFRCLTPPGQSPTRRVHRRPNVFVYHIWFIGPFIGPFIWFIHRSNSSVHSSVHSFGPLVHSFVHSCS